MVNPPRLCCLKMIRTRKPQRDAYFHKLNGYASYTLTAHAGFVLGERDIPMAWVSRALEHPERTEPDRTDSALIHALGRIPEFGNRILRVIYNDTMVPKRIVTASFERIQWDKI